MIQRKTELNLVAGINGSGKTTFINEEIIPRFKKAIVITPDPAEWRHLPIIDKKDIRTLNGVGRIIYYDGVFEDIQQHYFGGVLILDDAKAYIEAQTDTTKRYIYIRRRQYGIDIYMCAHSIRDFPPKCFDYASWMFLYYTNTGFRCRKDEIDPELYEKLVELQKKVKEKVTSGEPHYKEIILIDQQIRGLYESSRKNNR